MTPQFSDPVLPRAHRYRMVVGVDLSEYSDIVIEHALDQAARHIAPDLHFLVVKETRKQSSEELHQRLADRAVPLLEAFNRHGTSWRARLHVRAGKPNEEIAGLAADLRAHMIVIGAFGLHHAGSTLRTLPSAVLRDAVCPTLVVPMPLALDASPRCGHCDAAREDSDGEQLFCAAHTGDRARPHDVDGPVTTWTGGLSM